MTIKTVSVDAIQLDGFRIETKSRQHIALVDQPIAGGGTDSGPTPLEYLFVSLAGCIVTIGHIIAKQRRLPVRGIKVHGKGELDTDILMGKSVHQKSAANTGLPTPVFKPGSSAAQLSLVFTEQRSSNQRCRGNPTSALETTSAQTGKNLLLIQLFERNVSHEHQCLAS